jgi:hypothetical protein
MDRPLDQLVAVVEDLHLEGAGVEAREEEPTLLLLRQPPVPLRPLLQLLLLRLPRLPPVLQHEFPRIYSIVQTASAPPAAAYELAH